MTDRPAVAVWRSAWLPASETFVRDHVVSLRRYRPVLLGLARTDDRLGLVPDRAPFAASGARRKAGRVLRRLGYPGVYDGVLRRERPALLHAHFGTDATECRGLVRRHRLPFVVTFHGYDVTAAPFRDGAGTYRRELGEVWDRADLLLPVSRFVAGRLRRLGAPEDKLRVHYLGIPTEGIEPARPPAEDGPARVVFVGRLVDGKGVDRLIEAYGSMRPQSRERAELHVLGDGELRPELERLASRVDGRIVFHGRVTPAEVAEHLRRATVFAGLSHPTKAGWDEGLGLVFLEASRAGLPVVASRTGGISEAVVHGETGLLADPGDTATVTGHLERLIDDARFARDLGARGRDRVLAEFDLSTQTGRLESLYDEVRGETA